MPGAQGHITVRRRSKNGKDAEPTVTLVPSVPTVNVPLGSDGYVESAANDFDVRVVMKVGLATISTFTSLAVSKITGGVYGFYPTEPIPSTGTVKFHLCWDDKVTQLGVLTNIFQVTGTAQYKGKTYTETCDICVCFVVAGSSTTGPQGNAYTIDGPELIRYNEKTGTAAPETVTWTARNNGSAVNTTLRAIYNGSQISTFTSGGEFGVVDFLDQEAPGLKSGGTFTLQMLVNNAVVATKTVVVERVREIVFRGPQVWQSGRVYYGGEWDAEANLFVVDITTQKVSGTWYYFYCKKKNSNNTTLSPWDDTQGGSRGGTYWVRAEKIPFVATELLLADGAVIDWLQGRTMILTDTNGTVTGGFHGDTGVQLWLGATTENKENAPFRVSNTGALYAENATISGEFTVGSAQQGITINASGWMQFNGQYTVGAKTYNNVLTIAPDPYNGGKLTGVGLVTDTSHNVSASAKLYLAPSCIETIRIGTTHSVMGIGGVYEGLFLAAADFDSDMSLPQGYTDYNLMSTAYSQYYKEMIHITPEAIRLNSSEGIFVNDSFYSNPGITLSSIGFNADQAIADSWSGGSAVNSGHVKILEASGGGYIYLCFYGGILRGVSMEKPTGAPYGLSLN